ncbi:Ubiquitin--protein ligase [Aphelenchoides fujianensis]|nr:Ubiquitin--protein ligase [Aphelenchoides fujianensis]
MDASQRRLAKELSQLVNEPPAGLKISEEEASVDMRVWTVSVEGASNTLYEGETFKLQFKFDSSYPFSSPEVTFVGNNIPVHPHIYSNGHICLSILADDWTPALNVQSVCLSIVSMLSSCRKKERPMDDAIYTNTCHKSPSQTRWWFHDDKV